MKKPHFPVQVFYDGGCRICATEIEHYLRRDQADRLIPIDISQAEFEPARYGISRHEFMFELHVLDREGTLYRGVDAFWAIWQAFPTRSRYGLLGKIITLPIINRCARLAYRGFARLRKYLPKRESACSEGNCPLHKEEKRE